MSSTTSSIQSGFDSNMYITDLLSRSLENSALDVTLRAVNALAEQYNFKAEDAIAYLKLEKLSLNRKQLAKKASGVKEPRAAGKGKTVKAKADKLGFSLPLSLIHISEPTRPY